MNIRQVTDSVGAVLQDNLYYPYGMQMGELEVGKLTKYWQPPFSQGWLPAYIEMIGYYSMSLR